MRLIRQSATDAWCEMWAQRWFRAMVYFDGVVCTITAVILGVCYFGGKIGLIKW